MSVYVEFVPDDDPYDVMLGVSLPTVPRVGDIIHMGLITRTVAEVTWHFGVGTTSRPGDFDGVICTLAPEGQGQRLGDVCNKAERETPVDQ